MSHFDMPSEKLPLRWRLAGWALLALTVAATVTVVRDCAGWLR